MITSYKSIWEFLRTDFPLTFKNSLLLAAAYTFLIPVIRGISNLDAVRSADVFGQSLTLIGVFLFVPITSQELESGIKEIVYTKVWSYKKSVSIRLICGFLLSVVIVTIFAGIMQLKNCNFPFLEYISVTILYAVFLGLLGLLLSQVGNNVIVGDLASLGYWSFCQLHILEEGNLMYLFPIINGKVDMEKLLILIGINVLLLWFFFFAVKYSKRKVL
ncbi:MAG: hypothetical protein OGM10_07925 [Oscillospiraceae bacterium]|nr:MAG: hypothetical protein OGM10_07925 [Oscillospiraceae bacterium]